jgi:hypothetical protein
MKNLMLILLAIFILSGCNGERPISEGMSIIPNVKQSILNNELVNSNDMKVMQEVYDYYFSHDFTEDKKEPYVKYISLKADLEIYNKFIKENNEEAVEITKERIMKKLDLFEIE